MKTRDKVGSFELSANCTAKLGGIFLLASLIVLVALSAARPSVGLAQDRAGSANGNGAELAHKAALALMPPAFGMPADQITAPQQLASNQYFQPYHLYPSASWPEAAAWGRWGGDERGAAALTTAFNWDSANDHSVHLFTQTSGGSLSLAQVAPAGETPMAMRRGDFNEDGLDDLVTANQDEDTIGVFLQNSGGGLGSMTAYPVGTSPDGVAVGDFNGDLRDDIAVTHAVSQTVVLYYQQADGSLGSPAQLELSSGGFNDLAAGDLNGDGYDDLVVLRGAGHQSAQIAIFYQHERALSAPVFRTAEDGGFLAHGLAVGDVNGDGRADIVVSAGGNAPDAYLNVFIQQAGGSLAADPIVYPAFHLPEAVEIGDIDHDGLNDVLVVHAAWMALSVYTQTPSAALSSYTTVTLPYRDFYRPDSLALGDLNRDGGLDVLVANHSYLPAENGLVVLENSGLAPTSTITLPAGGVFISDTLSYQIEGLASSTAVMLEISTDGGLTWQAQAAASPWSFAWSLPVMDGIYRILSRASDANGQVQSPAAQARVIVDRTAPSGTLLINGGDENSSALAVSLTLAAQDSHSGVCEMQIRNAGARWPAWQPYTTSLPWTLSAGEGPHQVEARYRDCAGNISAIVSDSINRGYKRYLPLVTR